MMQLQSLSVKEHLLWARSQTKHLKYSFLLEPQSIAPERDHPCRQTVMTIASVRLVFSGRPQPWTICFNM